MTAWRMVIDVALCEDCNNCLLACKDEHVGNDWPGVTGPQPKHGARWIDITRHERGQFPLIDVAYRPEPCQHCADAPCIAAAGGAIARRPDGIVLIDPQRAKGRRELVDACPYGAIHWSDEAGAPQKCTLCAHLLDAGWKEPRCVQCCPTGALRIERVDHAQLPRAEQLHPEYGTRPRVRYLNQYRVESCFIAGSVATAAGELLDCVEGARVALRCGIERVAEATTDCFGDFRFDGLAAGTGPYTVEIATGSSVVALAVELRASVSFGVIRV